MADKKKIGSKPDELIPRDDDSDGVKSIFSIIDAHGANMTPGDRAKYEELVGRARADSARAAFLSDRKAHMLANSTPDEPANG